MNDATPLPDSAERSSGVSIARAGRLRTNIAWGITLLGAVVPGVLPIAVFVAMAISFMGDAGFTPLRLAERRFWYLVFVAEGTFCDFAKFWRLAFYGPTEFSASRWARCVV